MLNEVDDIHFARLTSEDVVRHTLVGRIVDAYTKYDASGRRASSSAAGTERVRRRRRAPGDFRPPQNRAERRGHDGTRAPDGTRDAARDYRKDR